MDGMDGMMGWWMGCPFSNMPWARGPAMFLPSTVVFHQNLLLVNRFDGLDRFRTVQEACGQMSGQLFFQINRHSPDLTPEPIQDKNKYNFVGYAFLRQTVSSLKNGGFSTKTQFYVECYV